MRSDYPFTQNRGKDNDLSVPLPSRLIDEKLSDESDKEAEINTALKPAGLKNPFWN